MKPKVGFIGIGAMGRPMATNLLKKEYQVTVFRRRFQEGEDKYRKELGGTIGQAP